MQPYAHRSQVYSLDPSRFPNLNLAGTSEVGIAGIKLQHSLLINIGWMIIFAVLTSVDISRPVKNRYWI